MFTKPFQEKLSISDAVFFESIAKLGERFASDTNLEKWMETVVLNILSI
jgi:hypothetical protein